MTIHMTIEDLHRMAQDIGLGLLTTDHLDELMRATGTARARRAALPTSELSPMDEPAHVFRLDR